MTNSLLGTQIYSFAFKSLNVLIFLQMHTVGGRELRSLLELLAIWSCHIWPAVRIKIASLAANLRF